MLLSFVKMMDKDGSVPIHLMTGYSKTKKDITSTFQEWPHHLPDKKHITGLSVCLGVGVGNMAGMVGEYCSSVRTCYTCNKTKWPSCSKHR